MIVWVVCVHAHTVSMLYTHMSVWVCRTMNAWVEAKARDDASCFILILLPRDGLS